MNAYINGINENKDKVFQFHRFLSIDESNLNLSNSIISSTYAYDHGGAIESHNSNLIIQNSSFIGCESSTGGAIVIWCSGMKVCTTNLSDNNFTNNFASLQGGAIYYDSYIPLGLENNSYSENFSPYGVNYGSYAVNVNFIR